MRRIRSIYLSGPNFHLQGAMDLAQEAQGICRDAGFEALAPDLEALKEREPSEAMAREIYAERAARMRRSDAAVVDLTPFRGPHCDPATAFETGFLAGLGKPVFAYMNVGSEDDAELAARVEAYVGAEEDAGGVRRDEQGVAIEDYGLPETLMLWAEARRLYVIVTPDPDIDLTGLRLSLEALKLYVD